MDSRFEIKSIKKSQIHTHMLGLSQKLTKFDIAWKDKCCIGFWVWFPKIGHERVFVYRLPQSYRAVWLKSCKYYSKTPKIGGNWRKHENSGNLDVYGVRNNRKHYVATTASGVSTDPSSMTLSCGIISNLLSIMYEYEEFGLVMRQITENLGSLFYQPEQKI